jgi:hypothetical protein
MQQYIWTWINNINYFWIWSIIANQMIIASPSKGLALHLPLQIRGRSKPSFLVTTGFLFVACSTIDFEKQYQWWGFYFWTIQISFALFQLFKPPIYCH